MRKTAKQAALLLVLLAMLCLLQGGALADEPCEHALSDKTQVDFTMPTCSAAGSYTLRCTICGNEEVYAIEPLGHTFRDAYVIQPSTCSQPGQMMQECEVCGQEQVVELPLAEHVYGEWSTMIEPTCAAEGVESATCQECGAVQTRPIPMLEHDFGDAVVTVAPTCVSEGASVRVCAACGLEDTQVLPPTDHVYGSWAVAQPATDHSCGLRIRTCQACGRTDSGQFYPEGTLRRDVSAYESVTGLQRLLADLGYLNDATDGLFGPRTEAAVKAFQAAEGLSSDGIAWPQTINRLAAAWQAAAPGLPTLPPPQVDAEDSDSEELPCCFIRTLPDGEEELLFCPTHAILHSTVEALLSAAADDRQRLALLQSARKLWEAELEAQFDRYRALLGDDQQDTADGMRTLYLVSLQTQEQSWSALMPDSPDAVLQNVIDSLTRKNAEMCALLYTLAP